MRKELRKEARKEARKEVRRGMDEGKEGTEETHPKEGWQKRNRMRGGGGAHEGGLAEAHAAEGRAKQAEPIKESQRT